MDFLFHGSGSEGDVPWLSRSGENPERTKSAVREGQAATVQWVGSDSNRCQTFPRCAVRNRFCTLAPYAAELLSRQHRDAADCPARCARGQSLSQPDLHFSEPAK